jgi:hypothetical protein
MRKEITIMNTNYLMLRELLEVYHPKTKGIVSTAEQSLICNTLHIKDMADIIALRNLRDFIVLFLCNEDDSESWDKMSAIINVIDTEIFSRGGEV